MFDLLAFGAMPLLGFFTELSGDMILVLKIFVILAIIAYVTQHLGKGPLAIIIIVGISYFVIFDMFWLFGGVYVLYLLLVMGLTGVIIDFMFVTPSAFPKAEGMGGEPISNGKDFNERQAHYQAMVGMKRGR